MLYDKKNRLHLLRVLPLICRVWYILILILVKTGGVLAETQSADVLDSTRAVEPGTSNFGWLEPEPKTFRWWSWSLKFAFRFRRDSLWGM